MTPAEFDQRRAHLDELLSRPHLWPGQVALVRSLAEELGVQVVIVDRVLDWDWKTSSWRPRTDRTRLDGSEVDDATVV